jgi:subtilase family serine protease
MQRRTRRERSVSRTSRMTLEQFERRELLSVSPGRFAHHLAERVSRPAALATAPVKMHTNVVFKHAGKPQASAPPGAALTPAQIRHIYGFDQITNLGAGETIAIVDAYNDPNIAADADTFDKQFYTTLSGTTTLYSAFGASSSWLTVAYAQGSKPATNAGWDLEISLDVEWAHAIAPEAKILLVEAASSSNTNLYGADTYAATHGASVISNSWGGGESSGETKSDNTFSSQHGVTFVFSAGDSGNQEYPAESPYVVSVGGTTLSHNSSYLWTGETGWSDGGGGVSAYEATPSYQNGLGYKKRADPDIAYDADPNSGVAVYDSVRYGGQSGWYQVGGTSMGAPQWSALIALADEGRGSSLDGYTQTLPAIYAMTTGAFGTSDLYDVTTGKNSEGSAGPGYDLVTGMGTPADAELTYQALVSYS